MKNLAHFSRVAIATLCIAITAPSVVRADPPHSVDYVEDPMAPHKTNGQTARLGTSVGFLYGERSDVLALGIVAAGGKRWGRFALEGEYGYFQLSEKGPSDLVLGDAQRLGLIGRFEVLRLGSSVVGGNSMLAFYIEGGAAVAWNDWYGPQAVSGMHIVPTDTKRVEAQTGFGVMLDHRLQEPIGFPHRIGWFLGWRVAMAPHGSEPASVCRGGSCKPAAMSPDERFVDRSMLFQSSLSVTW